MKLGVLRSIGHNISDSFACGVGFMIGLYSTDVYGEAAAADPGFIEIDFLNATVSGSPVSENLRGAIRLYRDALPGLCQRHRVDSSAIRTLTTRFGTDPAYGPHFTVRVETTDGRSATDQYVGWPGRRLNRRRS